MSINYSVKQGQADVERRYTSSADTIVLPHPFTTWFAEFLRKHELDGL